jgi:hypothetical protein
VPRFKSVAQLRSLQWVTLRLGQVSSGTETPSPPPPSGVTVPPPDGGAGVGAGVGVGAVTPGVGVGDGVGVGVGVGVGDGVGVGVGDGVSTDEGLHKTPKSTPQYDDGACPVKIPVNVLPIDCSRSVHFMK